MEQGYFYLTITGDGDANAIKKQLELTHLEVCNDQGMCLKFAPVKDMSSQDVLFFTPYWSRFITLSSELVKTLHFVTDVSAESQSHGCHVTVDNLKDLAVINADFMFHAKQCDTPCEKEKTVTAGYAYFLIGSYRQTVDEISQKLGFKHNHRSFNFSDIRKSSKKPYGFTSWDYKSSLDEQAPIAEHIESLVNELYPYKSQVLAIGNEIDISYGMSVTGHMPNEYEFHINTDTIRKLAEMRISLDFDMYFLNNY